MSTESVEIIEPVIKVPTLKVMPHFTRVLCLNYEGWVVGSAAQFLLGEKSEAPRDWDVLIPFWQWGKACLTIPRGSVANSFGGFNVPGREGEVSTDVWAGDIGWFLAQTPMKFAKIGVQLSTNTVLRGQIASRSK